MAKTPKNFYQFIYDSLLGDIQKDATKVTKDIKQTPNNDDKSLELKAREKTYTNLTEDFEINYRETHKQKRTLKSIFFWFIMPLYAIIILGSMFAIIASLFFEGNQIEIVLGATGSIIASVIAIPMIIAKYLFPTDEDKDMTSMINKMQNYDNGIRKFENSKNEKNQEIVTKENKKDD